MPERLIDTSQFQQQLSGGENPLPLFRNALKQGTKKLEQSFRSGADVVGLVRQRAALIDFLLLQAWRLKIPRGRNIALLAVGGYGRGELHPCSDIDIMILLGEQPDPGLNEHLSDLLTFFWDIGLEVGHSVRTLDDCVREAKADITVATNLMESRLLDGPAPLYEAMRSATGPDRLWPSDRFFEAKWEEQKARYLKYDETVSSLEPNVKESPGGLRDIQMIGWVVKRHFGAETMHELVELGFLSEFEYQDLMDGQAYLWKVRYALHLLAGRRDDRILFDYQRTLADEFGFQDNEQGLGVEQFMQQYYQTAIRLSRMNEMLLQHFQEAILLKCHLEEPKPINRRFQSRSGFLEVTHDQVFAHYPVAMLEMFLLMEQHPELQGVRASTIRLIRQYRHLIDEEYRKDIRCRSLFMEILRQPQGIFHELRRMNRYGILSRYIPGFEGIVGRMQYDLFHVYTVDEHTLFVIRNLRRFAVPEHRGEFPLGSTIMEKLPKPELLFLAALFHDIAKGRGGNHSVLGAQDAWDFCQAHGLSQYDSRLVSWLVENHLLMSITAQRKDISDPEVVRSFALAVKNPVHLDYLYLLTLADIRATDPKKWNSWKHSLLRDLYLSTKQALFRGLENPQERDELIGNTQAGARHLLLADGYGNEEINNFWKQLSLEYFLYHTWEEIAWHTRLILSTPLRELPLLKLRKSPTRGGTEVLFYGPEKNDLFALLTRLLDQLGLNIVSARLETADTGYSLNSYLVLEQDGTPVEGMARSQEIISTLQAAFSDPENFRSGVSRRIPRRLKHFSTPTRIDFVQDRGNQRTIMKLVTDDRPGLLSQVGYAFASCRVRLIAAKIATIGAEAEDTFFITDDNNRPLTQREQFECLEHAIYERLGLNPEGLSKPAASPS